MRISKLIKEDWLLKQLLIIKYTEVIKPYVEYCYSVGFKF